jgi:uncharacterized protein YceK
MKKILTFLEISGMALLLSGCGTNEMLTCTDETTANGMTTKTTYDIEYKDNDVKYLKITHHYTRDNSVDGVGTGTDGSAVDDNNANDTAGTIDTNTNNDGNLNSDDIVDGVVGDAIDTTIGTVTDTILDIAGIRNTYDNQINTYNNINGFTSKVEVNNDDEYKVVYEIDYDKISDTDLATFNASRDLDSLRSTYESQGLTCK